MWTCPACGREFVRKNQSHYCGEKPANMDDYIARQPENVRGILADIRNAISAAIPDATETIAWGMPNWKGRRNVIQFAAGKNHVGLYAGEAAAEHFRDRLAGYAVSKGNIRLPLDKPMPLELIADIARWCRAADKGE